MLAKNLGTHLVWCQPIISSLTRFQKFLVTYQNFDYNDQFLSMNQMIAKAFRHALILAWQKLVANKQASNHVAINIGNSFRYNTCIVRYIRVDSAIYRDLYGKITMFMSSSAFLSC